jgi:5-methylcytosine-specific restriction endonuclease McrA
MAAISTVCSGCKRITRDAVNGRCPDCERSRKTDYLRSPRRAIYKNRRWLRAARACLTRDHWRCVHCGRHITELAPNERLGADHVIPVLQCPDPYDIDNLQALCSTCSGRKDGGRRSSP